MAEILPFPIIRRRPYLRKQVRFLAGQREDVAEKHLREAIRVQRETMERRGIEAEKITSEMRSLETAIRAGIWREVLVGGGDAA